MTLASLRKSVVDEHADVKKISAQITDEHADVKKVSAQISTLIAKVELLQKTIPGRNCLHSNKACSQPAIPSSARGWPGSPSLWDLFRLEEPP